MTRNKKKVCPGLVTVKIILNCIGPSVLPPLYSLIEFHVAGDSYANNKFRIKAELIEEAVKRITIALKENNIN